MRTIAIVNQKGGCGKTTTAINLAAVCAARGLRTLLVDMDPQSHCAAGLGVPDEAIENSIAAALLANLSNGFDRSSLVWEVSRNLDLAPSTMALAGLEAPGGGLHKLEDKDRRLAQLLRHLAPHYDRCLIDCAPNIGLLTYNALRAAGEAIIPVETGFFALRGAKRQWDTIQNLVERVNHPITCYVLPTMFDTDEKIARDILGSIKRQFGGRVIPLVIRERTEIREATGFGQPVIEYARQSGAVKDFEALADWLEDHPSDPPEIQVEITRSVTVPYLRDGQEPPQYDPPATDPKAKSGSLAPAGVSVPAAGGRAAEMARRVREMARKRSSLSTAGSKPAAHTAEARSEAPPSAEGADTSPRPVRALTNAIDATAMAARRRSTLVESKDLPAQVMLLHTNLVRMFGVRQTVQGVLFIQPGAPEMEMCVAGEFNGWSPTASPLRYNRDAGVYELLIPLATGRYEYRLIVDGRWQTDPYNTNHIANEYHGENNFFTVV